MTMSEPAIRVDNLSKQYHIGETEQYRTLRESLVNVVKGPIERLRRFGRSSRHEDNTIWALKDVSFEVQPGEVLGIIGPNGAGKSTLLKILSKITEPTEGRAVINGRVGSLLEVGTGFHSELTGRENIYLSGAILGMTRAEIDGKFDEIVDFSGVEKYIDTPVKRYSSGMRVRLGFAVAAHLDPEILLIDEVLAVGDAEFRRKCLGKMDEVSGSGRTVLFVSHNMAAIENLCHQVLWIREGYLADCGRAGEMVERYLSAASSHKDEQEGPLAASDCGGVELLAVNTSESGLEPVQCGRDVCLEILVSSKKSFPRAAAAIGFKTQRGVRLAVLHSAISGASFSITPGRQSFVCHIPRFPLSPGTYVLDVKMYSMGRTLLYAPNAVRMQVTEGDFYGTGKLPDRAWSLVVLPHTWARSQE